MLYFLLARTRVAYRVFVGKTPMHVDVRNPVMSSSSILRVAWSWGSGISYSETS